MNGNLESFSKLNLVFLKKKELSTKIEQYVLSIG